MHDNVRQEMRAVLADTLACPFIDQGAQELLDEARKTFVSLGLGKRHIGDCLTSRQLAPSLPSIAELTAGGTLAPKNLAFISPNRGRIPSSASRFVGVKTIENKKGSRDKISRPLELYGRDGVIRTLDP